MKYVFSAVLFLNSIVLFSQSSAVRRFDSETKEIEFNILSLDEVKIENSEDDFIEIKVFSLTEELPLITTENTFGVFKINVKQVIKIHNESGVFRKFITERIQRASAVIKIPKNKTIRILGNNLDVISESYKGDLEIYIDKGLVNLHNVQGNALIKLFQGNIFATLSTTCIAIMSNKGTIKVNDTVYRESYQKKLNTCDTQFKVNSIHANVSISQPKQ